MLRNNEFPYLYHIKVSIPSLNDLQKWKEIIPNLEFDPNTGELIIPSKDEGSALAVANLIIANLYNNLSITDILSKELLQISIAKAQAHEIVRSKLREQILSNTSGKTMVKSQSSFERDLASKAKPQQTENFSRDDIEAFDGNGYSYL